MNITSIKMNIIFPNEISCRFQMADRGSERWFLRREDLRRHNDEDDIIVISSDEESESTEKHVFLQPNDMKTERRVPITLENMPPTSQIDVTIPSVQEPSTSIESLFATIDSLVPNTGEIDFDVASSFSTVFNTTSIDAVERSQHINSAINFEADPASTSTFTDDQVHDG